MSYISKVAVVTKAPLAKSMIKMTINESDRAFFINMKHKGLEIGHHIQSIARKYFGKVDVFPIDFVYEAMRHRTNILEEYELIIPVGGDGTFLSCAQLIANSDQLFLGVNSRPEHSVGYLLELRYDSEFDEHCRQSFASVNDGNISVLRRKRLKLNIEEFRDQTDTLCMLGPNNCFALNDVFLGSIDLYSNLSYRFRTRESSPETVESTGCIMYTGSGSTARAYSMSKVSESAIYTILESLNIEPNPFLLAKIHQAIKGACYFKPDSNKLAFIHREMVVNSEHNCDRGYSDRIELKVESRSPFIAVDGFSKNLPQDASMTIELADEIYDLHCISLSKKSKFY